MATPDTVDPYTVRLRYSPHAPTVPQRAALLLDSLDTLEALYGGAAGGGKSDYLLMRALRYVDVPGYAALLLRRTYADLALPGALMDRANLWLAGSDATYNASLFRWTFPSTATLTFGYLQTSRDRYRYASAEFQFIGFDELTQFPEADYRFLFSRLRRPELSNATNDLERRRLERLARVPLGMRAASNPGGIGHEWVKRRFITKAPSRDDPTDTPDRIARRAFIPARLDDNPHVDRDSYREALAQTDAVTRARLELGDWDADDGDKVYPSGHIGAARQLGDLLDRELAAGTIPPPSGGLLAIGLDWGEHSHALIGWPLPGGGLYVVTEIVGDGAEPGDLTARVIEELTTIVDLGRRKRPADYTPPVDTVTLRRMPAMPPALPGRVHPVRLVEAHRYDAAGVQSMRTYASIVRRHHARAITEAIPFGAPAPRSGSVPQRRSYKAETIYHLRRMMLRSAYGPDVSDWDTETRLNPPPLPDPPNTELAGALAIGARCVELRRQLPGLEWADREAGTIRKGDDHGPDALIALDAPIAIKTRRRRA